MGGGMIRKLKYEAGLTVFKTKSCMVGNLEQQRDVTRTTIAGDITDKLL